MTYDSGPAYASREGRFRVKAPGASKEAGPFTRERLAELFRAGLIDGATLVSEDGGGFRIFSDVFPSGSNAPRPLTAKPALRGKPPAKTATPAPAAAPKPFTEGYEVVDLLMANLRKEAPKPETYRFWRDPRWTDKRRFVTWMIPVVLLYCYAMSKIPAQEGEAYRTIATTALFSAAGMVWFIIFIITPTRAGFR